ncbi:MAG: restriction endonuclease subunit S [Gammaproteobacteria bacterium]|nr:restriction endonuclease subunit S [Gammaproteobacteria bacterium]
MTDRLHLSKKHRQILETLLREYFPGVEVWAYGSRVNGRSHDGSDLDLVLRGSELKEIPTGQLGDFEEALRESTIPFLVEARDWARLPEQFHREIEKGYVVLSDSTCCEHDTCQFGSLFAEPTRNGLTRPKSVRGVGIKMVNMGELFANDRLNIVPMDRVPLDPSREAHFLLHSGDLLFARQSLVLQGAGKCSIFLSNDEPTTFESHVIRVRLDPSRADPLFYYYYWQSHDGRSAIRSIVEQGAGASGIRASDLATLPVVVRPIAEQRAIAHILGTLDDKIELNRRMNETLEAIARSIFKSWFVDFDPVRAKAENYPTGLPPEISDLFSSELVESEIGEIPKGWEIVTLSSQLSFVLGGDWGKSEFSEETPNKCYCIRGADIANLQSFETSEMPVRFLKESSFSKRQLKPWDVVFEISGGSPTQSTGRAVIITPEIIQNYDLPLITSNFCRLLRFHSKESSLFHFMAFRNAYARDEYFQYETGTTGIKNFGFKYFSEEVKYVIPLQELLSTYADLVFFLYQKSGISMYENIVLSSLRNTLIPKLMSGEVRLREVEKVMEALV